MPRPNLCVEPNNAFGSQSARRIALESLHDLFRCSIAKYDNVHVICTDVQSKDLVAADSTNLSYRTVYRSPLLSIQKEWRRLKRSFLFLFEARILHYSPTLELVEARPVDGTALVSVLPCSVGSESKKIGFWKDAAIP